MLNPLVNLVNRRILMRIVRMFLGAEVAGASLGAWQVFFSVFGFLYAVILGFLLAHVLGNFNTLTGVIEDEINAVEDIRDLVAYVADQQKALRELLVSLHHYTASVEEKEWPGMTSTRSTDHSENSDTTDELYAVMRGINQFETQDNNDSVAVHSMLNKLAEVTTFRTKRWHFSGDKLSPALRGLVLFLSLIMVAGFTLLNVVSFWIHGMMVFGVVVGSHFIFIIIEDLNSPFKGIWNIKPEPFRRVGDRIDLMLRQEVVFEDFMKRP